MKVNTNLTIEGEKEHEMSENCWCEPEIEEVYDEQGQFTNRIIIHRALH